MTALALPATPLITLQAVKEWLNTGGPAKTYGANEDSLFERLIAGVSRFAPTYLSRPVAPQTFTETYNGSGTRSLPLRQSGVFLVRSVTVGTTVVPVRPAVGQAGFTWDSDILYLDGGCGFGGVGAFWHGFQNVQVVYDAGFQTSEAWTVPSGAPPVIGTPSLDRPWNTDRGVAYASGIAFTLVASAPASAGQYQVGTDSQGNAQYVFAVADAGASIVITYGFTPEDIAAILVELAAERYRTRTRIGETSQGIQQQTTAFSQRDLNAYAKTIFGQYRNVVPR